MYSARLTRRINTILVVVEGVLSYVGELSDAVCGRHTRQHETYSAITEPPRAGCGFFILGCLENIAEKTNNASRQKQRKQWVSCAPLFCRWV